MRINEAIRQSVARLKKQGFQTHAPASADAGETKLLVRQGTIEVKIEVNFVMRGTVNPVRMASLTQSARDTLQARPRSLSGVARGRVWRQAGRCDGPAASPRPVRRHAVLRA